MLLHSIKPVAYLGLFFKFTWQSLVLMTFVLDFFGHPSKLNLFSFIAALNLPLAFNRYRTMFSKHYVHSFFHFIQNRNSENQTTEKVEYLKNVLFRIWPKNSIF